MSQISSASGVNQTLYQLLQGLSTDGQATTTSSTKSESASSVTSTTKSTEDEERSSLFAQLEDAVLAALEEAQSDPSADADTVISNAISEFFAENEDALPEPPEGGQGGPPPEGAQGGPPPGNPPSGETDAAQESFFQQLESYGIDREQFRKDFESAIESARNGDVDASTAFKSFPTGTSIDMTS